MLSRLKSSIFRILTSVVIISFFAVLTFLSVHQQLEISSIEEIQSSDNVTESIGFHKSRVVKSSRNSVVNVMSMADTGYISSSSGTYFTKNGKHYIITVSHGVYDECSSIRILTNLNMYECVNIALIDRQIDYAIIEVEEIPEKTAIRLPKNYPKPQEWKNELSIMNEVFYTGYPNGIGPLTIDGKIIGHDLNENLFVHSFAWPGSSGSGVFSESGNLIGIIAAISIGTTEFGVDVLEDIVIVIPLYKINWDVL